MDIEDWDRETDAAAVVGAFAADFSLADVPEAVRERARLVLLDTVGVCVRGADTDYLADTLEAMADVGTAPPLAAGGGTVLATRDRRSPAVAAFANATGGTTLELDEGNQRSAHMGIHTVPPALALAEHRGASGEALLEAVALAYEVGARLGDLVRPLKDGLHPHGAWAPVGAAVAAGHLLAFDAEEFAHAVRMAVNPFVATHWTAALEGATVRNFYTGVSCAHGLQAAAMAAGGVTGVEGAIERCLLPYTAAQSFTPAEVAGAFETLGDEWYLRDSYFKIHAACRYTHAPIEALETILAERDLSPDEVECIRVRTFELGTLLDGQTPENPLAAKFSTPYALAARLLFGTSGPEAFAPERVRDDQVQALASRVEVVADEEFEARAADGTWGAAVEVTLADGTTLAETVTDARGGGDDPFSRAEIVAKFEDLVGSVADEETTAALRDDLLAVERVENAEGLLAAFR